MRLCTVIKLSGNGSNALDFHIAFYLGVLAVRDSAAYFHIISKDTGYDPLIRHLRAKNIKAHRFEDDILIIKKSPPSPPPLAPALEPHSLPAAAGALSALQPQQNGHPVAASAMPKTGAHATNGVAPSRNGAHAPATPNGAAVKAVHGRAACAYPAESAKGTVVVSAKLKRSLSGYVSRTLSLSKKMPISGSPTVCRAERAPSWFCSLVEGEGGGHLAENALHHERRYV